MCYMTVLSTTATTDLSAFNNDLVRFSKELPGVPQEKYLAHPFKWFIGSRSGCSCEFRHLYVSSVELGFREPVDWFPEEVTDIAATQQIAAIIRALVARGEQVDCVDAWTSDPASEEALEGEVQVDLSQVGDASFRFFEMHRFTFTTGS